MIWKICGFIGLVAQYAIFKDVTNIDVAICLLFIIVGELQIIRYKLR